jgi:hypothetical protein
MNIPVLLATQVFTVNSIIKQIYALVYQATLMIYIYVIIANTLVKPVLTIHLVLHATQISLENSTLQPSYALAWRDTMKMNLKM